MVAINAAMGVRSSCDMSATACFSRAKARCNRSSVWVSRAWIGTSSIERFDPSCGSLKSFSDTRLTASDSLPSGQSPRPTSSGPPTSTASIATNPIVDDIEAERFRRLANLGGRGGLILRSRSTANRPLPHRSAPAAGHTGCRAAAGIPWWCGRRYGPPNGAQGPSIERGGVNPPRPPGSRRLAATGTAVLIEYADEPFRDRDPRSQSPIVQSIKACRFGRASLGRDRRVSKSLWSNR